MSKWFRSTPESEALLAEERLVLAATEMVHEAMIKAGKNKQELAGLLGVRPSEVSQRLSGRRNLTLRTLARMLHVLGSRAELELEPALLPVCAPTGTYKTVYVFQKLAGASGVIRNHPEVAGKQQQFRMARVGSAAVMADANADSRGVACNV